MKAAADGGEHGTFSHLHLHGNLRHPINVETVMRQAAKEFEGPVIPPEFDDHQKQAFSKDNENLAEIERDKFLHGLVKEAVNYVSKRKISHVTVLSIPIREEDTHASVKIRTRLKQQETFFSFEGERYYAKILF